MSRNSQDGGNDRQADFIRITLFGKQAETFSRHLTKGRQVAVEGRIQTGSYQNQKGDTVYTTDIIVGRFYFVGNKTKENLRIPPNDMTPMYIRVILKRSTMRTYRFRREHVKKKREKICEYCGKTYMASYEKQRYCSRSCSSKSKGLIEKKRICKRCGKIYIQPKGEYSLFCSEECSNCAAQRTESDASQEIRGKERGI